MKHKHFSRFLSLLLVMATMLGMLSLPANAASLADSATVTINIGTYKKFLSKSTGGTLGGSSWTFTSNDGLTGTAYCVNWGLKAVSPSKALAVQEFNRNPQTMGVYANGYPTRTLAQFKELHKEDVRYIDDLTEVEYQYATQVAIWASCGQLSVPGTSFTAGRASVVQPSADTQQIRIYDSIVAILKLAAGWTKHLYTGMYLRAEENRDVRGVEVVNELGLEGAAAEGTDGIKKETIGGVEYYTRTMYVASATSTWIDEYKTKVYSTDAPNGTIFVAQNNSPLETVTEGGTTYYKVDTHQQRTTNLNANGTEYYGAFKVCIPVNNVADEGEFTIQALGGVAQFNLFLAFNPTSTEQSYIISDPGYTTCDSKATFKWSKINDTDATASLQVVKAGDGGAPLEGAKFTLTSSGGNSYDGVTDRDGRVEWTDLPADERYVLAETSAPEGYTIADPVNITLTAGRTAFMTISDSTEKVFRVKKVDAQNKGVLQGAVFRFEQIDGPYKTTGTTGFDGVIQFVGDELPYGSYRITEQSAPEGYQPDTRVETVDWTGEEDVTLTFENVRDVTLILVKQDANTGASLANATFDVFADGQKITSVTTNGDGEARITGIKKEAYISVVETAAPAGYVLDPTPHGIHIDPYDPATEDDPVLTVTNQGKPALRIVKYDQQTKAPMPNVTFRVTHDNDLLGEYTTDDAGEVFLYELDPGTYLVQEIATDTSHVINPVPQQIELKAGQTGTQTLIFFNSLKPGIHLTKVDSITMQSLPNVRFEFKQVGGTYKKEYTTDANGEIDLSKLTPGSYEVRELEAPDGYLIDNAVRVVKINPDENANFIFTNTPKPVFKLVKTSSDGTPLKGIQFRIAKIEDGTHYLDRTTDERGEIIIPKMEPGTYSVKETATDSRHILDLREYHVELFPGRTSTIVLENQVRPNLIVYKHDADTEEPIANTVFLVEAADGHSVDEIKTDAQGKATLENLLPGVYEISEKSVPAPWLKDAPSQLVTLYANRDHTVYFKNHKKPTLTVNKVDSITKSPIKGAKFQVWYGSNSTNTGELNNLGTYFSDANGQFTLDLLRDGWYKVTELAPAAGFTIKEPVTQEFYIEGGKSKEITFENVPLNAIVVEKYDSVTGDALAGCTFQLRYLAGASGTGGTVIGQRTTGKNGMAIWSGLKPGAYVVEEVDPGEGYSIIQTSEVVNLEDNGEQSVITVSFRNMPDGVLLIRKVCSVNPSVTLANAEFKVTYADGTLIGDANGIFRSDENGEIRITGLKPGKSVVVTETRAPAGFLIDTQSQTAQIKEGRVVSLTFKNQPKGELIVQKRGPNNEVLPGVEFRLSTAAGCEVGLDGVIGDSTLTSNGIFTTDGSGEIRVTNLAPGAYVLTELKTVDGYVISNPSTNVVIGPNGDAQTVIVRNDRAGSLLITKKDSVTGKPLSDVQFYVTDSAGQVIGNGNGYYTTDSAGTILIPNLVPGITVVAKETRTRDGYVLDDTPQTVKIKANETVTLEFRNQPAGELVILKEDSLTGKPLAGVTFKVTTAAGEFVPDESGRISSNGIYLTDKNGKITIKGVVGTLVVTETRTIPGYTIDPGSQTQTVVVNPHDVQTLRFFNTPSTTLIIEKYVEGTGNQPLKGVTFLVTDSSGAVVGKSNGEFVTDENGRIEIEGLTPGVTVTAREVKTLDGFVLDGTPKSILIQEGTVQTLRFYNKRAGTLLIKKLDSVTKKPLAGVEFSVTYADGSYVDADNGHLSSKGLYWTDSNGEIRISGVTGTLVVTEEKTIEGYSINEGTRSQTVSVNALDTQTLYFYNDPVGGVEIVKVNSADKSKRLPGATFEIRKMDDALVDTVTTGSDGRVFLSLEAGSYYAVETEAPQGFKVDPTPHYFTVKNGKSTPLTVGNAAISGILIKKIDSATRQGIYGVTFLLYDDSNTPIGQYTSDDKGYVYIEGLEAGRYYLRELENDGYIVDEQRKTVYVKSGETTEVIWENTAITGQIQITKTSSDYNSMNGWPAGTPIPGTVFEIYHYRTGNLVDTIRTDKNGVAVSRPLPLGRYKVVESKAADFYGLDKTPIDVEIEHPGQIVKAAMTNKPLYTNVSIEKSSYAEVMPGQTIRYTFSKIGNNSTTALTSFYWRDTLPTNAVRLSKIITGTWSAQGNYKIVYRTNLSGSEYRTLADSLSTRQNYTLDASPVALRLASNEYVTEFMYVFGVVPAGFGQVEAPKVDCTVLTGLANGFQFVNQADVGGVYNGQWIMATTRWVTKVYAPSKPLPRTGY